ncbi:MULTISPECIES: alkene reductase [unclassified Moorena]|uniref:alkene reductase n=1 Tax=unclassified Moorena TaxID=2683338 RepID=UPI0013FF7118|nr:MULTISPECIES: alkene reductase [unclassified Moorena]NEO16399.1 alkene reductase [Moorena sp. SIO3E8]NEQ03198.1 alkene reductase [Moorena sp. SIO3F7]
MTTPLSLSKLLSPFELGDLSLKNRVVMPPLTRGRAVNLGIPNDLMVEYYTQRTGVGLIITEGTFISPQANGWVNAPGIYTLEQTEGWKKVVSGVHSKNTPLFLQLWHCGRASHSSFHDGKLAVAPSAIKINEEYVHTPKGKQPHETPRALETEEIPQIVEDYKKAAENAKEAGFDGVEIHSANGYLLDSFLQSKTNQRTDNYGGSIENRYRLLKEVIEAVITVFPVNRVGVRLSPNGVFNDMGSVDYRETFLYVAKELNSYGLAYIHLLDGLAFGFHELGEPMTLAEFKNVFDGPIIGNCGYTKETAEAAIQEGVADLIAFGRPILSNPDLVDRFANNWPLNPIPDVKLWYSPGKEGYTDFPTYKTEN